MDKIEKASDTEIKITTTTEAVVALVDLKKQLADKLARLAVYQKDIAAQTQQFNEYIASTQVEIDDINAKIKQCEDLGVVQTVAPVSQPDST